MSEATQELIEEFRNSSQKLKSTSRFITLGIVGIILVFLILIFSTFRTFANQGVPQLVSSLQLQAAPLAQKYSPKITSAIQDAIPAFANAFHKTLEKDLPNIERQMSEEASRLENYLENKWPLYEQEIQKMILEQEETIVKEFSDVLTEEAAENLAFAYGDALNNRYQKLMHDDLKEHIDVADSIAQNLQKIAEQENVEKPINLQEALGLFLELAGIEIQSGIEKFKSSKK